MSKNRERKLANAMSKSNMELQTVVPLTNNQKRMLDAEGNLVAHGSAGTGKTYLAMAIALRDGDYDSVTIIRSAVPTRDMGFLPGSDKEKAKVYESPYMENASKLFGRGDAYEVLKNKGTINFMTTSFVRGLTLDNTIVIVDECQNMTYHELDSIVTRVGKNCRIIFCGDWMQSDLKNNGIKDFYDVLREMREFTFIEFGLDDIVRSDLVKNYLITKARVLNEGHNQ